MPKSRCRFLLVTHLNDGRPIEPEYFLKVKKELDRRFGGYRMLEPTEGSWQGQVEATHEIEVLVYPRQITELRKYVMEIGRELGQSRMYFDPGGPATVELIDPETGLDEPGEE